MSVRRWKQVITVSVLIIILVLAVLAIVFGIKYGNIKNDYEDLEAMVEVDETTKGYDLSKISKYFQSAEPLDYQTKYSKLYVDNDFTYEEHDKVCYLTFDDGPSTENTEKILKVLKKYNVKATFFVVNKKGEDMDALYKQIVDEGHTIAVHTATHNYEKIYSSVTAYLKDFNRCSKRIEEATGVKPELFRFPGGSVNSYNYELCQPLIAEMLRRGYTYYDWNVSSGDATGRILSEKQIYKNVVNNVAESGESIVLMHDSNEKDSTVEALDDIIETLTERGYTFDKLDKTVKPIIFSYL